MSRRDTSTRLRGGAALAALLASACAARTEILVQVDTELEVPRELDRVELRVAGSTAATQTAAANVASRAALPLTLWLEPRRDPSVPVTLTVVGLAAQSTVATHTLATRFVPGAQRTVRVMLRRACTDVLESDASRNTPLLGSTVLEPTVDENPAGVAEAFSSVAAASGTVASLHVYLDAAGTASEVHVGLYADDGRGNPGRRLTFASTSAAAPGAWLAVTVPPVAVTAGARYWIAVLGPADGGVVRFRARRDAGCPAQLDARRDLRALPEAWTPDTVFASAPLSAYASE